MGSRNSIYCVTVRAAGTRDRGVGMTTLRAWSKPFYSRWGEKKSEHKHGELIHQFPLPFSPWVMGRMNIFRFLGYRESRVFKKQSGFNAPRFWVRGTSGGTVNISVLVCWFGLFETRFHYCSSGWPGTHDLSASASWVMRPQTCTTMPRSINVSEQDR